MRLYKPHLTFRTGRWYCASCGVGLGLGETPLAAYLSWIADGGLWRV